MWDDITKGTKVRTAASVGEKGCIDGNAVPHRSDNITHRHLSSSVSRSLCCGYVTGYPLRAQCHHSRRSDVSTSTLIAVESAALVPERTDNSRAAGNDRTL